MSLGYYQINGYDNITFEKLSLFVGNVPFLVLSAECVLKVL